ncbi:hypothetical protein AGMMS49546_29590 [Spirochaetia bacterium]|nr:hypothetical protein AGMMS49546_29590 [Spirochaetia bacterium]
MKNYKVILGIAALALVFGLVLTGCPTQVEGNVGVNWVAPAQVERVTVEKTTNNKYYIVSFKAVDNAGGYKVFLKSQGDDKHRTTEISGTSSSAITKYDLATGAPQANEDLENYYIRISKNDLPNIAGSYHVGVSTVPLRYSGNNDVRESDIKWTGSGTETAPITLNAGPKLANVQVNSSTVYPGGTVIITWNDPATSGYTYSGNIALYKNGVQVGTAPFGATGTSFTASYAQGAGTYQIGITLWRTENATNLSSYDDVTTFMPTEWYSKAVVLP